MQGLKQTIIIDRSASDIFDFTLNPENTPKWIDSIVKEHTNETPTKLGTIYRNQSSESKWKEYEITAYKPNVMFTLSRKGGSYHVKYTFKPLGNQQCELEYYEWSDDGNVDELFTKEGLQKVLQKLKDVIEHTLV